MSSDFDSYIDIYETYVDRTQDYYLHPSDQICFDFDLAKETMEKIIDMMYGKSEFDLARLDDMLAFMGREFGLDVPVHEPLIEKKENI